MVAMVSREVTCPLCASTYDFSTPRNGAFSLNRRDSDYCPHYSGTNPLFYMIWVCPNCHFAAYKEHFKEVEDKSMGVLREHLKNDSLGLAVNFAQEERSLFAALRSFQIALTCYLVRKFPADTVAGVAMRAGWMCRYAGELKRELNYLEQARDLYKEAFDKGIRRDRNVDDLAVAYLIGELMLRTGQIPDAMRYFMLLIQSPDAKDTLDRSAKDRLYDSKQANRVKEFLDDIPLLQPMGEKGLGLLAVNSETKSLKGGAVIFHKGQPGESMFVVSSGHVQVYLDDPETAVPVATLGPGDAFGEMSLFTGEPRSATVLAGTPPAKKGDPWTSCEVIEIRRPAVRNLIRQVPEVVNGIATMIAERKAVNESVLVAVAAGEEAHEDEVVEGSVLADKIRHFFGLGKHE